MTTSTEKKYITKKFILICVACISCISLLLLAALFMAWYEKQREKENLASELTTEMIQERITSRPENRVYVASALLGEARRIDDPAEQIRIYDDIIATIGDSRDVRESREVIRALNLKALATDDREGKIKVYDQIIARGKNSDDRSQQESASEAMFSKGNLLENDAEKIQVYDEIIAKDTDKRLLNHITRAWLGRTMIEKAELIDNKEEKIRLYDSVLFGPAYNRYRIVIPYVFRDRLALTDNTDEKLQLLDRFLTEEKGLGAVDRISLLLDKAGIMTAPADKSLQYDEIIEYCESILKRGKIPGAHWALEEMNRAEFMAGFGKAILGKGDILKSTEEKLKLYDTYLARPQPSRTFFGERELETILTKKAELSDDPSIKNAYFDHMIRTAATKVERARWHVRKTKAAEGNEKAMIEDALINAFIASTNPEIEHLVADTLFSKAQQTSDAEEKARLLDQVIGRYRDSADDFVSWSVLDAFAMKAEMTEDKMAKLDIYTDAIERYEDSGDSLTKMKLREMIAAKSKLESEK